MDPQRWRRVRTLFEEAADREPAGREEWLRAECNGDEDLFADVLSLLRHDSGPGAVEGVVAGAIRDRERVAAPSRAGTSIGAYRVLELIGEGGMGAVWLAERTDGAFDKRVALKVVRGGPDSPELVRRFRAERRILARLEHPGIARILDGGETDDGLPYLVLEHVVGETLDRRVRARQLPLGAIVDLFLRVCDAVEYAHSRLILHRDLKPANILVDEAGHPKLLDFGIAKVLDRSEGDSALTRAGGRLMTPVYAAPEQIRGDPVSTATDVYALGVTLYELIAGEPPFRGETGRELETAVLERDPGRPSARKGTRGGRASELDDIVLLAMHKDPARRYPTVAALGADLRRWRDGLPVTARPPTFAYRAGKFLRRHRLAVGAGAAVLVALLVGTFGLGVGMFRARQAEEAARLEAATAQRVVDFLVGMFSDSDPNRERGSVTARELLDEGAESISRLEAEPLVMARLLGTMGVVFSELGDYERARDQFERALAAREETLGSDHPEVAANLNDLANVERVLGRYDESAAHYERAIAIKEVRHGTHSVEVARTLYGLGVLHADRGESDRAQEVYERTLAIQAGAAGTEPMELANTLNALAGVLMQNGDLRYAMECLERSMALTTRELGPRHPRVVAQQTNLAILALEGGDHARARQLCEETLPILEETRGPGHPQVAVTLNTLAKARHALGDTDAARSQMERSLGIWETAVGAEHPQVATSLVDLATLLSETGNVGEAASRLDRAVAIREHALGADHPLVAEARARRESLDGSAGVAASSQSASGRAP